MDACMRKDRPCELHPRTEGTHAWHRGKRAAAAVPEADNGQQIREQLTPVREHIAHQIFVCEVIPRTRVRDPGVQADTVTATAEVATEPDIVAVGDPRTLEGDLHALI